MSSSVEIRRLALGETKLFRSLRLLALKTNPEAFGSDFETASKRSFGSWEEQANSTVSGDIRTTLIAFVDEVPIGMVALYRSRFNDEVGELLQMWIAPEARRKNIGRRLVKDSLDWAQEAGFKSVIAAVNLENLSAKNLYEKCGFSELEHSEQRDPGISIDLGITF